MELKRLEEHLHNWREYMHRPGHKLGYPSKSLCIASGNGSAVDAFDIECEKVDTQNAETLDALIDSLPPNQRAAVHHKWLHAVYRLRDMEGSYLDALENLMLMADRRGMV